MSVEEGVAKRAAWTIKPWINEGYTNWTENMDIEEILALSGTLFA